MLYGIDYVPPAQSRFLNDDEFDMLQDEITTMCCKYDYVFISGDFNAQTGELADYTKQDDFLCRQFEFDEETRQFYGQKSALQNIGVQTYRKSMEKKKNTVGYKLLAICKRNNLAILNGRYGKDKNIGRFTFRGLSVIDYTISSV